MNAVYATRDYLQAVRPNDEVLYLESLGIHVSIRSIPGSKYSDAVGPYPFTDLKLRSQPKYLTQELCDRDLVSLTLVTNSLWNSFRDLTAVFDVVNHYKTHYLIDLTKTVRFSKHHRYEIRKAYRTCTVKEVRLGEFLDPWSILYSELSDRHRFSDMHRFSRAYFEYLASLPELVCIGGFVENTMVACYLWIEEKDYVYSHLGASNLVGYRNSCSYAIHEYASRRFQHCRAINLGGVPDRDVIDNRLGFFKRGFSNASESSFLCGIIADKSRYEELTLKQERRADSLLGSYFPSYRAGEHQYHDDSD